MFSKRFPRAIRSAILGVSLAASACAGTSQKPNVRIVASSFSDETQGLIDFKLGTLEMYISQWINREISKEDAMKKIRGLYFTLKEMYSIFQNEGKGARAESPKTKKELSKAILHLIKVIKETYKNLFNEDIDK